MAETFQAFEYVNKALEMTNGVSAIVEQDWSNIVDVGKTLDQAGGYDHFVQNLANVIGATVYAEAGKEEYQGVMPPIMRSGADYGSMLRKIRVDFPDADPNETWELEDGAVYEQDKFTKPVAHEKFYNHRNTFEIPISIARKQARESFHSGSEMVSLVSFIERSIRQQLTEYIDELERTMYKDMIGETIYDEYGSDSLSGGSHVKAVNLLYLYNQTLPDGETPLTVDTCRTNAAFLRFCAKVMTNYKTYLKGKSRLYNIGGTKKYTPEANQVWVMLADFVNDIIYEAKSVTFNEEIVSMPTAYKIPYWQGSGTDMAFSSISQIYGTTSGGHSVQASGIVAVVHDDQAMAIWNSDRYVDTHHNGKASFDNFWYKYDENDIVDYDENLVVFLIA